MSKKDKWQEKRRKFDDDEWGDHEDDRKRYDQKRFNIREKRRDKNQKRESYLDDQEFVSYR